VIRILACLLSILLTDIALAREAVPLADDPALEQRVMQLSTELRCLVCQNETLADSRADLAIDLRNQIREQMHAGKSDEEIKVWLTQRYGDFVLYRPPVKASTWLLWFGPFALMILAAAALLIYLRRRRVQTEAAHLTEAQHRQAQALLDGDLRDEAP
jgi:cytochrome c-type biogenesis protein CcmH